METLHQSLTPFSFRVHQHFLFYKWFFGWPLTKTKSWCKQTLAWDFSIADSVQVLCSSNWMSALFTDFRSIKKKTALSWTKLSINCLTYKLWRVLPHNFHWPSMPELRLNDSWLDVAIICFFFVRLPVKNNH